MGSHTDGMPSKELQNKCLHFSICACHPRAGAMLVFSVRPVRLYYELGSEKVWLKQALISEGWEFPCPYKFTGSFPESLIRGRLAGELQADC